MRRAKHLKVDTIIQKNKRGFVQLKQYLYVYILFLCGKNKSFQVAVEPSPFKINDSFINESLNGSKHEYIFIYAFSIV